MRNRRSIAGRYGFGLFAGSATVLGGCASQPAPTVRLADLAITDQSAGGIILTFRMRAENRGTEPLPLRAVRYEVNVDGRAAFTGTRLAEATAPPARTQEFVLPVALSLGEGGDLPTIPAGDVPYTLTGSVEYELPGTIADLLFDSGIRRPTAAFSESGRIDFTTVGPGQ